MSPTNVVATICAKFVPYSIDSYTSVLLPFLVLKIMTVQRNVFYEVANLCGRNRKMNLDYSITDVQWEPTGGKNCTYPDFSKRLFSSSPNLALM